MVLLFLLPLTLKVVACLELELERPKPHFLVWRYLSWLRLLGEHECVTDRLKPKWGLNERDSARNSPALVPVSHYQLYVAIALDFFCSAPAK